MVVVCSLIHAYRWLILQVAYDPGNKSKPIAIRIKKLPKGSIKQDQVVSSQAYTGTVVQDQPPKSKKVSLANTSGSSGGSDTGLIKYIGNHGKESSVVYLVSSNLTDTCNWLVAILPIYM